MLSNVRCAEYLPEPLKHQKTDSCIILSHAKGRKQFLSVCHVASMCGQPVVLPLQWQQCVLASLFTAEGESMLHILHTSSSRTRHVRPGSSGCCVYISVTGWPCGSRGLITLHLCVGVMWPVYWCYINSSSADVKKTEQFYLWQRIVTVSIASVTATAAEGLLQCKIQLKCPVCRSTMVWFIMEFNTAYQVRLQRSPLLSSHLK